MARDPFAAPRQTVPHPRAQETEDAWCHAHYRNPLAQYASLWEDPPDEPVPEQAPPADGPSTWAAQEQASIKEHAA